MKILKQLFAVRTLKKIPKTLVNLKELQCQLTKIKKIPKELVNLKLLACSHTKIKKNT